MTAFPMLSGPLRVAGVVPANRMVMNGGAYEASGLDTVGAIDETTRLVESSEALDQQRHRACDSPS